MRNLFLSLLLIMILGLAGCVTTQELQQQQQAQREVQKQTLLAQAKEADCGPLPPNWQTLVKAFISEKLKDPDSAKFSFNAEASPTKGYDRWKGPDGGLTFFWVALCHVNAKNSYGGYTGNKLWWIAIKDGKVLDASPYHPATAPQF